MKQAAVPSPAARANGLAGDLLHGQSVQDAASALLAALHRRHPGDYGVMLEGDEGWTFVSRDRAAGRWAIPAAC